MIFDNNIATHSSIRLLQIRKCMHRRKTMKKIEVALAPYTPYLNTVAL